MEEHFILAGGWIIYCILHSVLAAPGVKNIFRRLLKDGFKYYRPAYVIFSFTGLALLVYYHLNMRSPMIFGRYPVVDILGILIGLAGLLLMAACIKKYFMNMSGLRSLVYGDNLHNLMISGIHSHLRHPLYLGTFAFIWGLFLVLPYFSLMIVNTIITIYTLIGIYFEEKKLVAEFGEQYENYRQEVPALWPSWRSKNKTDKTNG